jgi:hypothetical protein
VHLVFAHHAVAQFADQRGRAERNLVHAVAAPHHQRAFGAEFLQHAHLDADEVGMEHAHQDVRARRRDW